MDFEHIVILKPELLVGDRKDSRPGEYVARSVVSFLGRRNRLKDSWAQDADVVAAAAVEAGLAALDGQSTKRVTILAQHDIVRMRRGGSRQAQHRLIEIASRRVKGNTAVYFYHNKRESGHCK